MLQTTLVRNNEELQQILQLQQENLLATISAEEMQAQGFVTMHHDLAVLQKMNALAPSVIIKDDDIVIAYALTMLKECSGLMPALEPMFALFETLNWQNKPLNEFSYYVMGQICVAKAYRGKNLVNELYQYHKKIYQQRFDLFLTEISTRNSRSLKAHEKAGFKTIHIHKDKLDEWAIVAWDWS
ncbi:MAG TPA: GNAT family N-acetyltransferase [Chitinophagaceae bacterium]